MSPERLPTTNQPTSKGWAKHERDRKAQERRQFQPIPSWEEVYGKLDQRTYSNYELHALVEQNRFILREFYDARYDISVGKGSAKLNKFTQKYTQNEDAKTYNPQLIDRLSPLFHMVKDSFPNNSRPRR